MIFNYRGAVGGGGVSSCSRVLVENIIINSIASNQARTFDSHNPLMIVN